LNPCYHLVSPSSHLEDLIECNHTLGYHGLPVVDYLSPTKLQGHVRLFSVSPLHHGRGSLSTEASVLFLFKASGMHFRGDRGKVKYYLVSKAKEKGFAEKSHAKPSWI
jgi:hypothetical protein